MRDNTKPNLDNESQLYCFLHRAHNNDIATLKVNIALMLVNFFMVHWRWGCKEYLDLWGPVEVPLAVFVGFVAMAALLVGQMVLGVLYQKQLLFVLQVKIYRFVLFNKICEFGLENRDGGLAPAYIIATILAGVFTLAMNYLVLRESICEQSSKG